MRRIDGWYPSVGDFKALAPRASPTDWLVDAADDTAQGEAPMVAVNVDDVVNFDHWVPAGTATMFSGDGEGGAGFHLSPPDEPVSWTVCRNPLRADLTEFASLAAFAAYWLTEDRSTVGIEFGTWTLGVAYVIEAGPVAVAV